MTSKSQQTPPPNNLADAERVLKVVVVGDGGVGKTNILERLSHHRFDPARLATSNYDKAEMWVEVGHQIVRLEFWDTAGQEEHRSLAPIFYRGAHICLLVYDVTNRKSFEGVRWWYQELINNRPPALSLLPNNKPNAVLVGTKSDMNHLREVPREEGEQVAGEWDMDFAEQSSIDSHQASELAILFGRISLRSLKYLMLNPQQRPRRISTSVVPTKPNSPLRHVSMLPAALPLDSMDSNDSNIDEGGEDDEYHDDANWAAHTSPVITLRQPFPVHERRSSRVRYYELDGQTYVDENPEDDCAC
jgi:small GTP-binding protein